jgi:protein farnesyltransferase subunit beta
MSSSLIHEKDPKPIHALSESESTKAQQGAERECQPYFVELSDLAPDQLDHLRQTGLLSPGLLKIQLLREKHVEYLSQIWKQSLRAPFVSLDSSRPWMLYWCLQGCDLLGEIPTQDERCRMVSTLEHCWKSIPISEPHPVTPEQDALYYTNSSISSSRSSSELDAGGFGGGPGQMAHAATTYAAILSLCILATMTEGGDESSQCALSLLKRIRIPLYRWMVSLQQTSSGGYRMHHDGEVDVRASYTILCCAKLLQIVTPYLCQDRVVNFIRDCQTFDGGLGGEPWNEAHGGYAYCGVSALQLLGKLHVLDLPALTGWLARRQMSFEGGFSGRSNKLVDGCYSFWQGGAMAITSAMYNRNNNSSIDPWLDQQQQQQTNNATTLPFPLLFDAPMLERYILLCAQDVHGGLRDKPSKSRDFYHSCYNLSGLSIAQHCDTGGEVFGHPEQSLVAKTHPCYNIRVERVQAILQHQW